MYPIHVLNYVLCEQQLLNLNKWKSKQQSTRISEVFPVGSGPYKSTAADNNSDSGIGIGIIGAG